MATIWPEEQEEIDNHHAMLAAYHLTQIAASENRWDAWGQFDSDYERLRAAWLNGRTYRDALMAYHNARERQKGQPQ